MLVFFLCNYNRIVHTLSYIRLLLIIQVSQTLAESTASLQHCTDCRRCHGDQDGGYTEAACTTVATNAILSCAVVITSYRWVIDESPVKSRKAHDESSRITRINLRETFGHIVPGACVYQKLQKASQTGIEGRETNQSNQHSFDKWY